MLGWVLLFTVFYSLVKYLWPVALVFVVCCCVVDWAKPTDPTMIRGDPARLQRTCKQLPKPRRQRKRKHPDNPLR